MNSTDQNINEILRQKFQNFEPEPPVHVWENIEKSLDARKGLFFGSMKYYAAAILLLILIPIAYFGFYSNSNNAISSISNQPKANNEQLIVVNEKTNAETTNERFEEETNNSENTFIASTEKTEKIKDKTAAEDLGLVKLNEGFKLQSESLMLDKKNEVASVTSTQRQFLLFNSELRVEPMNSISIASIYSFSFGEPYSNNALKISSKDKKIKSGHWENTFFISPEFSLTNLDSVSILNSYSIGVEPSRYFNENWFVRFGLNISVTGDKGFAKVDYISNEFMGTYDDVYDVTFDTINGIITPNYHTKTVEIWDSIRHISVSEVTNRYLFAQIPALLGYKNKLGKLNWYVFGGPAIGFQIVNWIDEPSVSSEDIEIINLDNKLPLRSSVNYQIWVGAGIEYKLGSNSSIIIEPLFKHYFKSLYSETAYKVNTSGFALRIGYNYKIKY